jgi:hypothetical protein
MEINPPPDIHAFGIIISSSSRHQRDAGHATLPPYEHDHVLDLKTFHTYEDLQEMIDDAYNRAT